jgi:hypothetical protein
VRIRFDASTVLGRVSFRTGPAQGNCKLVSGPENSNRQSYNSFVHVSKLEFFLKNLKKKVFLLELRLLPKGWFEKIRI